MQPTFFFYDYETTGIDPKSDRILQFAGIRTDLDFNVIGEPVALYAQLDQEIMPNLEAILITGITPEVLKAQGLAEVEFLRKIYQEFIQPSTCVVGYNNIRFDDEFTRYSFYRNFLDPYAREWQNNNSRFDFIDVVRMCAALRPEGIVWPKSNENKTNKTSFKLNDLTTANNLDHYKAHDALSDVYATIEIAKLIKRAQPKLLSYLLQMRKKDFVNQLINTAQLYNDKIDIKLKLFVHSSRMVSSEYYGTSVFLPLFKDPLNSNGIISWDLRHDPKYLFILDNDPETIRKLLYTPSTVGGIKIADQERLHLKTVFINKAPALAPLSTLNTDSYKRIQLDPDVIVQRAQQILNNKKTWFDILYNFFAIKPEFSSQDVEHMLYDGFISQQDKYLCNRVVVSSQNKLIELQKSFGDPRLRELMFRYRARNYPETLTDDEQLRWQEYIQARLDNKNKIASISKQDFINQSINIINSDVPASTKILIEKWLGYYSDMISEKNNACNS